MKSFSLLTPSCFLLFVWTRVGRPTLMCCHHHLHHMPTGEIAHRRACHRLDRQGERRVQERTGNETCKPIELPIVQHKCCMQSALEDDLRVWREKGMGIRLGDQQSDCLSNLMSARPLKKYQQSVDRTPHTGLFARTHFTLFTCTAWLKVQNLHSHPHVIHV